MCTAVTLRRRRSAASNAATAIREDPVALAADAAFGDAGMYLEKAVVDAHHIEIQVMGDGRGGGLILGERECSIQRRHQKLIEEAPSPFLSAQTRETMVTAARDAVEALRYAGAGTIEFLVGDDQSFYFMEMNTRLQVEHPVTEMVTGIDIVQQQIKIAAGEKLPFTQRQIEMRGHAIECRINAEDPVKFVPSPGRITMWHAPGGPGVRVDSHAYTNYFVPPNYDSMIGKLIATGGERKHWSGLDLMVALEDEMADVRAARRSRGLDTE